MAHFLKKIIPVLLLIMVLSEVKSQGIRLIYVDPVTDIVKIKNFSGITVDISSYRFCANFNYLPATLAGLAVLSGSLNLAPDSTVSLTGKTLSNFSDLGLYLPTGLFSSTTAMVDFVEWGSSPHGRESVAVSKGIWSTGDFLPGVGPFHYFGDGSGTDVGVGFWTGNCLNLFFSEYYEGSSWNKALEIYNPTTNTIDLSNYSVERYTNGSPTATATLNLSGQLPPGDVYVIVHSNANNLNLINAADTILGFPNFNGNDAIALFYLTAALDIIGVIGQDSIWPVGAGSTQNNTLVRDSIINQGQTDWSIGAAEWIVFPIDDSTHIGSHTNDSCGAIICTNFLASAGLNDTLCAGQFTVFIPFANGGTGNYDFAWNADPTLSDTSIANPIASPSVTTDYIVTVTDLVTGCSDVDTVTVVVFPLPTANAGVDNTICLGICSPLLASGGAAYSWSPGAGLSDSTIANPIACPLTTTNYVVTVTDTLGCSANDTVTILVNPLPIICIIPLIPPSPMDSILICLGDTVTMMAVGADTYIWSPAINIDDPTEDTVRVFPTSTTTYTVTATDINGCSNDTMITILLSIPLVSVTPSPGTVCGIGDSVMLTASGALTYTWSPSDSLSNTTGAVVYANPTVNTVYTVIGTDSIGCVDITTVSVQISTAQPVPVFTADTTSGCGSVTVSFTNTSTDAIGYSWYLPGGTTADTTVQNPVVNYNSVGNFDVTLTAFGCSLDSTITIAGYITVNPFPVAGFSTNNVCLYDPAVFTDTSTISSGNIIAWQWNFGDGFSIDTNQNPSHNYTSDSLYFVTLSVMSNNGCIGSALMTIEVYPVPAADFTTINFCLNDTTLFADLSTINAPDSIVSWNWDFGDGMGTSTIQNPIYPYSTDSTYNVSLVVTTNNNCVDTMIQPLTINPVPAAGFTSSPTGLSVAFADASAGTALIYSWDFGDGAGTSIIDNPVYIYSSAATYNVCLTVTDGNGCEDTFCESVTVVETGIREQNSEPAISIYPNPTNNGMINVDFGSVIYDDVQLTVYNILGETMEEREILGRGKHIINLSGFAKGVYFLYFRSENFSVAKKISVQ